MGPQPLSPEVVKHWFAEFQKRELPIAVRKAKQNGKNRVAKPLASVKFEGMNDSLEALRLAAEKGDASAQASLGEMYYSGEDVQQNYGEAVRWFRMAAEQGNVVAQGCLGLAYAYGHGVSRDHRRALKWFRMAAEQGDSALQRTTGIFCTAGCNPDFGEAAKWFRMAAEQGDAIAQGCLGLLLSADSADLGVRPDCVEAHLWVTLAASRATGVELDTYGEKRRALARKMTPAQLAEAERLAQEWKPKTWEELQQLGY